MVNKDIHYDTLLRKQDFILSAIVRLLRRLADVDVTLRQCVPRHWVGNCRSPTIVRRSEAVGRYRHLVTSGRRKVLPEGDPQD